MSTVERSSQLRAHQTSGDILLLGQEATAEFVIQEIRMPQTTALPKILCDEATLLRIRRPPEERTLWDRIDSRPISPTLLEKLSKRFAPPEAWINKPEDF